MCFLRVFGFGFIHARGVGYVFVTEFLADNAAAGRNGFTGNLYAVSSHVRDETLSFAVDRDAFIEPLGHLHGARRRKAQLARGFLLQG